MKKQGTRWTLVVWTIHLQLFSLHFLPAASLHAVVRACGAKCQICLVLPFFLFIFQSFGFLDGKLRVAVDGDARQVVPDDLVDCKGKERKERRSVQ